MRLRHAQGRGAGDRRRHHRFLPRQLGGLQGAQIGGLRPVAENVNGQNPEIRAARTGQEPQMIRSVSLAAALLMATLAPVWAQPAPPPTPAPSGTALTLSTHADKT